MKVSVTQFYIKPGIKFPFSYLMQRLIGRELSNCVEASPEFQARYGADYKLVVYMNADTDIVDNVIKGPGVYKRTKDVEYTVVLPYDVISRSKDGCREALTYLLSGIRSILQRHHIDTQRLDERKDAIIESICSDATMLEKPWPHNYHSH